MCIWRARSETGFISRSLFESCVDQLSDMGLEALNLEYAGESLLHPEFEDLLKYAISKRDQGGISSIGWTDSEDNLWLFGGMGINKIRTSVLNDLWKFDGVSWTWISGKKSSGSSVNENEPDTRVYSISWTDSESNLWLFGGQTNYADNFNDLWKYEP